MCAQRQAPAAEAGAGTGVPELDGLRGIAIVLAEPRLRRSAYRWRRVCLGLRLFHGYDLGRGAGADRNDCCHRGYRDPGVDLAFTAVLAMLIRSDRGLLRLFRWRVPVWIGTISEGFYFCTFQA